MIRTKAQSVSADLKRAWQGAIAPLAEAALADFRTWPLYQFVGEPWPNAPQRCIRCESLAGVAKGLGSDNTSRLEASANSGLKAMYHNLSPLLNERQQYFLRHVWKRVERIVWRKTEAALVALTKRLKWNPGDREKGFWLYSPNTHLWQHVWEQLHSETIEAPFQEHFLTIYRAGHIPAGLQGDKWKTCRLLYY